MYTENRFFFPALPTMDFEIHYCDIGPTDPSNVHTQHAHNLCEVYLNLTGDVVFMVEDRIYPVRSGNVILTRPYENHHCIYKSTVPHKHYCLWFTATGKEPFLSLFFSREKGTDNRLVFSKETTAALVAVCDSLLKQRKGTAESYALFFRLISLLGEGKAKKTDENDMLPKAVTYTVEYLAAHPGAVLSVKELAAQTHMSVSSFERQFTAAVGQTPCRYLKEKRLLFAASLLAEGKSVSEAAEQSGFADYSGFIASFRRYFGQTPFRYRRIAQNKEIQSEKEENFY